MEGYYSHTCPECDADNMISTGDLSDSTGIDPEDFKCWKCGKTTILPKYENEEVEEVEDDYKGFEAYMPVTSYTAFANLLIAVMSLKSNDKQNLLKLLNLSIDEKNKDRYAAIEKATVILGNVGSTSR